MIVSIILLVLLGISALINFKQILMTSNFAGKVTAPGRGYGPRLSEVTVRDNKSANKIAVISVEGVISGGTSAQSRYSMLQMIQQQLSMAKDDADVKAVVLHVDSPGGEVLAADDINHAIKEFQRLSRKPVVVSMGTLAASGGYYISAPCDWIVANELTITGSIGVIMEGYNFRGLLDKIGVSPVVFKSGKFKDMLNPAKEPEEVTPEEKKLVQDLIDETFQKFKSIVSDGRSAAYAKRGNGDRGARLSADWEQYADGRILSGKEALKLGLVDELGDFDAAIERAVKLSGAGDADVIEYQSVFEFADVFRMFGKSDARAIKVDLGIDVPKLRTGCMYFLPSSYVP